MHEKLQCLTLSQNGFLLYAKIHEEYSECLHHKDIGLHNENTVNAFSIKDTCT